MEDNKMKKKSKDDHSATQNLMTSAERQLIEKKNEMMTRKGTRKGHMYQRLLQSFKCSFSNNSAMRSEVL